MLFFKSQLLLQISNQIIMYQKTISFSLLEMKSSAYQLTYKMGIYLDKEWQIYHSKHRASFKTSQKERMSGSDSLCVDV